MMNDKSLRPHSKWNRHCEEHQLGFGLVEYGTNIFDEVLRLRSEVNNDINSSEADEFDSYSEHYAAWKNGELVAALRVTRAAAGRLDCEEFYPADFVNKYHETIASGSRFVACKGLPLSLKIAQLLLEVGWIDQIHRGTRLDIMNAHERAVRYWNRFGWVLINNSEFVHPKWQTPSRVMLLPATPNRATPFKEIFEETNIPLEIEEIRDYVSVDLKPPRQRTSRKYQTDC